MPKLRKGGIALGARPVKCATGLYDVAPLRGLRKMGCGWGPEADATGLYDIAPLRGLRQLAQLPLALHADSLESETVLVCALKNDQVGRLVGRETRHGLAEQARGRDRDRPERLLERPA